MKKTTYERNLLIITVICEVLAYGLALVTRYYILNPLYTNPERQYAFYKIFVFYVVLLRVVLFYYYMRNEEREPVWKQGTVDLVATAIRQHGLLLILLTLFIYFINWSSRVSRTVMGCLVIYGIILDVVSRKLYAKYYLSHHSASESKQKILLIAEEKEAQRLKHRLETYGYINERKDVKNDCEVILTVPVSDIGNINKDIISSTDLIYISSTADRLSGKEENHILDSFRIPVCRELDYNQRSLSANMIVEAGKSAAVFESRLTRKCPVLGVNFTTAGKEEAVQYIIDHVKELKGKYICFSNVHTTVTAYDDSKYKDVLNQAVFVMPDGKPIAKEILRNGYWEAERVAGPDFMDEMFRVSSEAGIRHYFYGSSEKTIAKLKENLEKNYPGIQIAGMVSPPFRALTKEEDEEAVNAINQSGADLVWIGLGAPKQENWMYEHKDRINGLMLGVGAGFDFHAGTIKRAPVLIQKIGLEWLYRLLQNPKRLFKRYFVTNTRFIWLNTILRK